VHDAGLLRGGTPVPIRADFFIKNPTSASFRAFPCFGWREIPQATNGEEIGLPSEREIACRKQTFDR
jgi:hypothetical protein